jgi:hypothetical protein
VGRVTVVIFVSGKADYMKFEVFMVVLIGTIISILCCRWWQQVHLKCWYSRIPLIQHLQDQTGARLSNILDYETVTTLTQILTGNFLLLLLYLEAAQLNRGVLHLDISFNCWFRDPFYVFWSLYQEFLPGMLKDQETVDQES